MQDEQLCAVCLMDVRDGEICVLPGCRHVFHSGCVLNFVQYDSRCPVCRQQPEGVISRETVERSHQEELRHHLLDLRSRERRYEDRRRRFIRQRPKLHEANVNLREIRKKISEEVCTTRRTFDRKCREIWRTDEEISVLKKSLIRLRRHEKRLETVIDKALEELRPEVF